VKFISADIYSESPAIVTANVIPLKLVLKSMTSENICTGIFNLLVYKYIYIYIYIKNNLNSILNKYY